jgi:hypothetical protein
MKKRILLVLTTMLAVTQVWALEGNGASNNPYKIGSLADWNKFVDEVGKSASHDGYAIQTANISGVTAIVETFNGSYDGQGYTIEVAISGGGNVGLFGTVNDATSVIKNVIVIGGSVIGTSSNVGSIVGQLNGGKVQNCVNYASVSTSHSGQACCGGIVGYLPTSGGSKTVTKCMNFGDVTANNYVGGIAGSIGGGELTYCQNYGTISSTSTGNRVCGGIVGYRNSATLTNNHNGGIVSRAMSGSQSQIIQGSTSSNVVDTNTYLTCMKLIIAGTTYTGDDLSSYRCGAEPVNVNPSGIAIGNKTYAGPSNYTLSESSNNSEILNNLNGGMANVTLTRTLNPNGWNTFCAPFDISALQITSVFGTGTKVRALVSSDYDSTTKSLTLNFTNAESIDAGKPYLVWIGSSSAVTNPTFTNVIVSNTTTTKQTNYVDFVPVMSPTSLTGGNKDVLFVVNGNTLTFPTTTDDINGFRAYFHLTDNTATNARSFTMNFDDETTAISIMLKENVETVDGQAVYNLNGQRIAQPQRGLYIINGKKRIVK